MTKPHVDAKSKPLQTKRDFFGRIIENVRPASKEEHINGSRAMEMSEKGESRKVWVSFHEGFSNAVRKPITLDELMRGF